jgi:pimeloyl-ACP methyl ester carboxylesterase
MMRVVDIRASDGVASAARVCGEYGRALIFVHGVGSTAAIWDRQLAHFGDRYRCAAIELRGNGATRPEPSPERITRGGFALDVLAAMDALGYASATIVGCSLGGVVAMELWTLAPERIDAMVLLGTFAAYPDGEAYAQSIIDAAVQAGSMEAFAEQRAAKLGLPPERLRETIEQMARKSLDSYIASTRATWTGDYKAILPRIDVPVLVCVGERDTVAPLDLSRAIADRIPGSRLAVIPGAGHVANADCPSAFDELLDQFLEHTGHP